MKILVLGSGGREHALVWKLKQSPRASEIFCASGNAGTARIARYANTEVVVEVDAPSGAFLVLNDVWHSWWRADVDNVPADILKANVLFRAVQVAPGKHVVRFTFHPFDGALNELTRKLGFGA